jgi:hypothetical protein
MTMTRTEKADHSFELRIASQNSGYVTVEFAHPERRRVAIAATGHAMMPAGEYRARVMRRRPANGMAAERYDAARRYRRRPVRR